MGKRRFFYNSADKSGEVIVLDDDESRHIRTVLRLSEGDEVELFDGSGSLYTGVLDSIGKRVKARITGEIIVEEQNRCTLWLGQAVLKGSKVDELIPKCNELGVDVINPFESERCQGRLGEQRAGKKRERWQRMVEASCKQCGRLCRMEVEKVVSFQRLIEELGPCTEKELRMVFWEDEAQNSLAQTVSSEQYEVVRILLGPEGGFEPEEITLAEDNGWISVSLGKRVLRAETATIAAVALVQYLSGNLEL